MQIDSSTILFLVIFLNVGTPLPPEHGLVINMCYKQSLSRDISFRVSDELDVILMCQGIAV